MDTQFSNQSLKTELCGRIQQLQLMSKGMASAGDKMYQRVLHEMEQNSMKAYVRRHRNHRISRPSPYAMLTPAHTADRPLCGVHLAAHTCTVY